MFLRRKLKKIALDWLKTAGEMEKQAEFLSRKTIGRPVPGHLENLLRQENLRGGAAAIKACADELLIKLSWFS
jgi:hypothetical protein